MKKMCYEEGKNSLPNGNNTLDFNHSTIWVIPWRKHAKKKKVLAEIKMCSYNISMLHLCFRLKSSKFLKRWVSCKNKDYFQSILKHEILHHKIHVKNLMKLKHEKETMPWGLKIRWVCVWWLLQRILMHVNHKNHQHITNILAIRFWGLFSQGVGN